MRLNRGRFTFVALILMAVLLQGCATPTPTSTPPSTTYTLPQLTYQLLDRFPDYFWCDPDFYPIAREGQEQANANAAFPTIQANQDEFSAILSRLNLTAQSPYTDAQKLAVYREHKKLTDIVQMTPSSAGYNFSLRTGQGQGWRYEGTISSSGVVKIGTKVTSFNTCPICLVKGTLIDTPAGAVPVESLSPGMVVWTQDATGGRMAAPILRMAATPVPSDLIVVRLTLSDGRSVTASPGHPSAEGVPMGDYLAGDTLDGAQVVTAERVVYTGSFTYDILPEGATGRYWANGILLGSTLA